MHASFWRCDTVATLLQGIYDKRQRTEVEMAKRDQELKQLQGWRSTVQSLLERFQELVAQAAATATAKAAATDAESADKGALFEVAQGTMSRTLQELVAQATASAAAKAAATDAESADKGKPFEFAQGTTPRTLQELVVQVTATATAKAAATDAELADKGEHCNTFDIHMRSHTESRSWLPGPATPSPPRRSLGYLSGSQLLRMSIRV